MEKEIKALLDCGINGTGTDLFALILVDPSDSEDSRIELWRADSEDHLYDQVSEEFYDGEDPEDFHGPNFEEDIWGVLWSPQRIGKVE